MRCSKAPFLICLRELDSLVSVITLNTAITNIAKSAELILIFFQDVQYAFFLQWLTRATRL